MNSEATKNRQLRHGVTVQDRSETEIRGVTDVKGFDEETVILDTVCGGLTVEGKNLHIQVLDLEQGVVSVNGQVDTLIYETTESDDRHGKNGFFGRLFR